MIRSCSKVDDQVHVHIPTWAAYNSITSVNTLPKTAVGTLPLLCKSPTDNSILLTVLKQAQGINVAIMGLNKKTVVTLDMQLYEKAKQLEQARDDVKGQFVFRIGELHTVMTALRALGNAIEGSGIDDAWIEADIYGPSTVRQILVCHHMKRALNAHLITLQSLQTGMLMLLSDMIQG